MSHCVSVELKTCYFRLSWLPYPPACQSAAMVTVMLALLPGSLAQKTCHLSTCAQVRERAHAGDKRWWNLKASTNSQQDRLKTKDPDLKLLVQL